MNNVLVKSNNDELHTEHLASVFQRNQHYNIRLNLEKCTFGMRATKLLSFYLMKKGIEANPDNCEAIIKMELPTMGTGYDRGNYSPGKKT